MKVLIACEFSGIVREAFKKRGHGAYSCDLLESEIQGKHIKGYVQDIIDQGWDMMRSITYQGIANAMAEQWG